VIDDQSLIQQLQKHTERLLISTHHFTMMECLAPLTKLF